MKLRLCLMTALWCAMFAAAFATAGPANAAATATLSVADLTYTPWLVGGGPADYRQVITFGNVSEDRMRLSVPSPMREAIQEFRANPVARSTGSGYNTCYQESMLCDLGGSGTITLIYRNGFPSTSYPSGVTVSATLEKAGTSASGRVSITPRADVSVGGGFGNRMPREVKFSVESLGPSASGPLTVTITGFARQENISGLTQGCAWAGVTIECHLAEIFPALSLSQCISGGVPDPGVIRCHLVKFMLPPELPDKRLTAKVSAPYSDPNRANNTYTSGTDLGGTSGGGTGSTGSGSTGSGSTGSGSASTTAMASASPPVPSEQPSPALSAATRGTSDDPPLAQVRQESPAIPSAAWIAMVAGILLAAGGILFIRGRARRSRPGAGVADEAAGAAGLGDAVE